MSLVIDSLVTDLMFQPNAAVEPGILADIVGGQEKWAELQIIDPDSQDPQFEMQLSPSMPFRRPDERRLMLVDGSVAPMRSEPRTELLIATDITQAKDTLVDLCRNTPVRLGRIFALGSWGDAVWVVRSYRDLRGICLLSWALDPYTDVEGRQRSNPLAQREFEEKLMSYDKRLDELDESQIRDLLDPATLHEDGDLIVVDVLESNGQWDTQKSLALERKIAAIDRFSTFIGAKSVHSTEKNTDSRPTLESANHASNSTKNTPETRPETLSLSAPLKLTKVGDSRVVFFSSSRFSLDIAAALGKNDWNSILCSEDNITNSDREFLLEHGAEFIAPVEFLSEVFVDGKPLNLRHFEKHATQMTDGIKAMEVHFPRFGSVMLSALPNGSRFVCSKLNDTALLLEAIR